MEWNPKTPSLWDWESLVLCNGRVEETPKQVQPMDWGIEGDGGIDNGPLYSSGGGGGSASDLGNGSSSKSSISASMDSSSKTGIKESKYNFQPAKGFPKDLNKNKEFGRVEDTGTSEFLPSVGNGEPVIGLKLGKRTYFEDVGAGSTVKTSSSSAISTSSDNSVKRSRASYQSMQVPRCQVEGCNLDLTAAKEYHRRHRVCENHSKHPKVIVAGQERRFCQQCSRFHELSEFDEKKRSCRRRLSDHNARRRRPQTETISFNSARLSSSFYDGRQQMNLLLNRVPFIHERPAVNTTQESSRDFKIAQAKGSWIRTVKTGGIDGHLHVPSAELPTAFPMLSHDFEKLLPFKGTSAEVLNQGQEASMVASNSDTTLDSRRALSLLSTNSWGSVHPEPTSLDQFMHANNASMGQPAMAPIDQVLPHANSEYWQAELRVPPLGLHSNGGQFQEFQLFKAPYESAFLNSNHIR